MFASFEHLLQSHIARVMAQHRFDPSLPTMAPRWNNLLTDPALTFTLKAIDQGSRQSMRDNVHAYADQRFDDVHIVVSTIPVLDHEDARTYFDGGYLRFTTTLFPTLNAPSDDCDFVHWILCTDLKQMKIHLTYMPCFRLARTGLLLVAQDLMTPDELSQLG